MVDGELRVTLTRFEHVFGLLGNLAVPVGDVTGVAIVDDALHAAPGARAPGLAWPGRVKLGTWRGRAGRWYVVARAGQRALRLTVAHPRWSGVVVSVPDDDVLFAVAVALGIPPPTRPREH